MKKFLILILIFTSISSKSFSGNLKRVASIRASSGRRNASTDGGRASSPRSRGEQSSSEEGETNFISCMDNICKASADDERGRCRCSTQLVRIEKILRDIDKVQNEADAQNKNLEALMNVSNTSVIDDSVSSIYNNINNIENKAKTLASKKIDGKTFVAEGLPLYKKAYAECKSLLPSDKGENSKRVQEYQTMIEGDCSAYTSILKEKADNAQNLLVQAQKNREMFDEQQYKQLNQLDTSSCYVEYETCMKTNCGEDFSFCREPQKFETSLKKCQSVNYGKCEENKAVVIKQLRKTMESAVVKTEIAQSCRSAMGHIVNGKCVFKVRYIADNGDSEEKTFSPGYTIVCDDKRGEFKDLQKGCKESCYLVSPNGDEQKIGTNKETKGGKNAQKVIGAIVTLGLSQLDSNNQIGCKSDYDLDHYTLPIPAGWGADGFPLNKDLKNAF